MPEIGLRDKVLGLGEVGSRDRAVRDRAQGQETREFGLGDRAQGLWAGGSRARAPRWGMPEIRSSGWRLKSKGLGASGLKRQRLGPKFGLRGKVFGLEARE